MQDFWLAVYERTHSTEQPNKKLEAPSRTEHDNFFYLLFYDAI